MYLFLCRLAWKNSVAESSNRLFHPLMLLMLVERGEKKGFYLYFSSFVRHERAKEKYGSHRCAVTGYVCKGSVPLTGIACVLSSDR